MEIENSNHEDSEMVDESDDYYVRKAIFITENIIAHYLIHVSVTSCGCRLTKFKRGKN